MSFQIRLAGSDDLDTLYDMIKLLAEVLSMERHCQATKDRLGSLLNHSETWIAEVDGQVAGFTVTYPTYSTFRAASGLYVLDLYTQPAFRNQGVARKLIEALKSKAHQRGYSYIELHASGNDEPSNRFYQHMNFKSEEVPWVRYRLDCDE